MSLHQKLYETHQYDDQQQTIVLLDGATSSSNNLLLSKTLSDIPQKLKYETIMKPLFEYYFGTSELKWVWYNDHESVKYESKTPVFEVDWKYESYIYEQIFELPIRKIKYLANELNLWQRRSFVLQAIEYQMDALEFATNFTNDREIVLAAVKENGNAFYNASEELQQDPEIILEAVNSEGDILGSLSDKYKNDKKFVMMAVRSSGSALEYASDKLRNDKQVVLAAMHDTYASRRHVPDKLKDDRDVILKVACKCEFIPDAVGKFTEQQQNDKPFMMTLVKHRSTGLKYASVKLREDRQIVLAAVKKNGMNLEYAPEKLRNDREIVLYAVKNNPKSIQFITSEELKNDKKIQLALNSHKKIVKLSETELEQLKLETDRSIIMKAVSQYGRALLYIPEQFKQDREIVLKALETYPDGLSFISKELASDRDLVLHATKHGLSPHSLPIIFTKDREIMLELVKHTYIGASCYYYEIGSCKLKAECRELALEIVKKDGTSLSSFCSKWRRDREIVLEAVKQNQDALAYVRHELLNDQEILSYCKL